MILLLALCCLFDEASKVNLGGPRKVKVAISETTNTFNVIVTFLPVACFDEDTNQRLTRDKSKLYATLGVARHLKLNESKTLAFKMASVIRESWEGRMKEIHWRLIEVQVGEDSDPISSLVQNNDPKLNSLLDRKNEYRMTVEQLAADILLQAPTYKNSLLAYYGEMSHFEERSMLLMETLRQEVDHDKSLLSIEVEGILESIERAESNIQLQLSKEIGNVEENLAKPK